MDEGDIVDKGTIEVDGGLGEETNMVDEEQNGNPVKDDGQDGDWNERDLEEDNTVVEGGKMVAVRIVHWRSILKILMMTLV